MDQLPLKIIVWIGENWKLILTLAPFVGLAFIYAGFVPTLTKAYFQLKEALRLMFTTKPGFIIGIIILAIWAYFYMWYRDWIPK